MTDTSAAACSSAADWEARLSSPRWDLRFVGAGTLALGGHRHDATTLYARSVQADRLAFCCRPTTPRQAPDPLLGRLEGLVLAGGADIDPASMARNRTGGRLYGERDR
jgi:hypothetical protein